MRKRAAWRSCSRGRSGSICSYGLRARSSRMAWRSVFDGIVPVWIETPPTRLRRSITATRLPSFAPCTAARWPPGPEPITSRSRSTGRVIRRSALLVGGEQRPQALVLFPACRAALEVRAHARNAQVRIASEQLELDVFVEDVEALVAAE